MSTRNQNPRQVLFFDIDGTLTLEHKLSRVPHPIPDALREAIRPFYDAGVLIMYVTGAPWCLAEKVAKAMGFPKFALAADYGVAVRSPDGPDRKVRLQIDLEQYETFRMNRVRIERALKKLGGKIDKRDARFQVNAFFKHAAAWEKAKEDWCHLTATDPVLGPLFIGGLCAGKPPLRHQWNPSDNSVNILADDASKECAVQWARHRNFRIIGAAGDTPSDLPLARAAEFFIVARRAPGAELAQPLVDVVCEKGVGYLAPEDKLHGYGVAEGLNILWQMRQNANAEVAA